MDLAQFDFEELHRLLARESRNGLISYFDIQVAIKIYRKLPQVDSDQINEGEVIIQTLMDLGLIKKIEVAPRSVYGTFIVH